MTGLRTRAVAPLMLLLAFSPSVLAAPNPSEPPPMTNAPASPPPVEPLAPPVEVGAGPEAPATELVPPPLPQAAATTPAYVAAPVPTAREADPPIYERWWFWTAIAAFAVTAVVIVATSSGPNTPKTDLGNQPAF